MPGATQSGKMHFYIEGLDTVVYIYTFYFVRFFDVVTIMIIIIDVAMQFQEN